MMCKNELWYATDEGRLGEYMLAVFKTEEDRENWLESDAYSGERMIVPDDEAEYVLGCPFETAEQASPDYEGVLWLKRPEYLNSLGVEYEDLKPRAENIPAPNGSDWISGFDEDIY